MLWDKTDKICARPINKNTSLREIKQVSEEMSCIHVLQDSKNFKVSIHLEAIHRFSGILIKNPGSLFICRNRCTGYKMHINVYILRIVKTTLKTKNRVRGLTLPDQDLP